MWGGTRRLLLLQLGSPLRTIDRSLPIAAKLAIARTERMSAADVYRECASAAVDHLLMAAGGPVGDPADFSTLLATVKADFRTEARRYGNECSSTRRSRWETSHLTRQNNHSDRTIFNDYY